MCRSFLVGLDNDVLVANTNFNTVVDGGVRSGHHRPEVVELVVDVVFHLATQSVLVGSNHTITDVEDELADHLQGYLFKTLNQIEIKKLFPPLSLDLYHLVAAVELVQWELHLDGFGLL